MSGLETAAIALTAAVVKAAAKVWLGDRTVAADAAASALTMLEKQVPGLNERRRIRLLFTNLEARVADRMLRFLDVEYRDLTENERAATAEAVRETFERTALTDDDLFTADLDPAYLHRYLLRAAPGLPEEWLLSGNAIELYHAILRECCAYLVQITSTLPRFQPGALITILRRETEIIEAVRSALAVLPARRSKDDFAADFHRQVIATLDRMSLFGAGLAAATRLYPLSVAYLSLSVTTDKASDQRNELASADRIEYVLPHSSRILLRGEAGSGKTTLLQWLAVRSARRQLQKIDGWADLEPFLIRLRRYGRTRLPEPRKFLDEVGRHIADEMPPSWVQQQLRSGLAVLLVDGLDEVAEHRREEVREWLRELIVAFPHARYVVTTRPAAVEHGWLADERFTEVRLQPMTPQDIRTFIARWHAAVRADEDVSRAELDRYAEALAAAIAQRSALRRIAQNPLLCALLCSLHRESHARLPDSRIELYDVALRMLLGRRDAERRVKVDPELSFQEKAVLLRHLAYWMVRNGHTDAAKTDVVARIKAKLNSMGQIEATPEAVYRHLLDRGGVLREPVPKRVDFVHRTFQEYLAAEAAVEDDDIGVLISNAHLDEWREVVVMSAGHARPGQREKLLKGLLGGNTDSGRRIKLDLLALACLETSPELKNQLRQEIHRRTADLLPPAELSLAPQLACAGEIVLDLLAARPPTDERSTQAVVRTVSLIGGPDALEALTRYRHSGEPTVVSELIAAWPRFDPQEYAERVLARLPLPDGQLMVRDPAVLPALAHFANLTSLDCTFEDGFGRLDFVRPLTVLRSLVIADRIGYQLDPLAGTHLERLSLSDAFTTGPVDVAPLAEVPSLTEFTSGVASFGWRSLARLPALTKLGLGWVDRATRLRELSGLGHLHSLWLSQVADLHDLDPLSFLTRPVELGLHKCVNLRDLHGLRAWPSLERLSLSRCGTIGPGPLSALTALTRLDVVDTRLSSLVSLSGLPRLERIRLKVPEIPDLAPLSGLTSLRTLWLEGPATVSLRPLAGMTNLTIHATRGLQVRDAESLGEGSFVIADT
ncbi:MAG TPA: NACHT domain-containing protein [Amycolatopsis sp.]|uniref:NACHT domain-containing protein n=1 Tax=Amycolatopsis sp. TaxID=37632 RepID=UPI002B48774C|nr:NACHT domain-containing protein [Amycolatopsis sp.]HKS49830.1 NACHT domain-containing protein [Amycolatopsis sp.]